MIPTPVLRDMIATLTRADAALAMVRAVPPGVALTHEQWLQVWECADLPWVATVLGKVEGVEG